VGDQRADRGLALSFTTRAAGELRGRLSNLGVSEVQTATFHSAALRQLSYFWPRVLGGPAWKIQANKTSVLEQAARIAGVDLSLAQRRMVAGEIEWAKSSGLDAAGYLSARRSMVDVEASDVVAVWGHYQDLLTTKNLIDFEDVLSLTLGMFQQRPDVLDEVRRRYEWFTVDEFQDVTPLQQALLNQWLGDRDEICVVGDPAQTIYSFAGAAPSFLTDFTKRFPEATFVELARTYRCAPTITSAANSLLQSELPDLRTGLVMSSQLSDSGTVTAEAFSSENDEAHAIAARVKSLLDQGQDARQIAVLVRLNSLTVAIERAFDEMAIPYVVRGGTRFFDRREVKQVLLALRAESYSHALGDLVSRVQELSTRFGWSPTPTASTVEAKSAWEALSALVALASDVQRQDPQATVVDFFEEVARLTLAQHEPAAAAVTLATMHAAKGLEWDVVFLPGLNESVMPYYLAQTPAEIAEERRLMYVALTRARFAGHLSWPAARAGQPLTVSRFVAELGSDVPATPSVSRVVKTQAREVPVLMCRICGKGLIAASETSVLRCRTCPAPDVSAVFETLKQWRDDYAERNELLPWLVLTEATLHAIAELQPLTHSALRDIQGMSDNKLEQFGDELLTLLQQSR
jgi:DNA helicase-2/ATP-dependent DNA helicase PcrA